LLAFDAATLSHARLLAFVTSTIVPASVLAALGHSAYNFHPGPPDYPGLSPAQFALYDGARSFGATVHRMVAAVDAGPIVAVSEFAMPESPTLTSVETLAFQHLARLFWDLSPALMAAAPLEETVIAWGSRKSTKRSTEAMCDIGADIAAAELHRRIAAFGHSPMGLRPTVTLHGYRFRLEADQPRTDDPAPVTSENATAHSVA
jgi:methionyl-tRNA formyltransferase